jgi:hypothetical protein
MLRSWPEQARAVAARFALGTCGFLAVMALLPELI